MVKETFSRILVVCLGTNTGFIPSLPANETQVAAMTVHHSSVICSLFCNLALALLVTQIVGHWAM